MNAFIDERRGEHGVEPICGVLQVAPSTYYSAKSRPVSAREVRDVVLMAVIVTLWQANYRVYGVRKMWKALGRAGEAVGRDQVARLMHELGIAGARRGRQTRTTKADDKAARAPDLVDRKFVATRPNELWVTDLTYVATWAGTVYVCFIVDVFSRTIVGWRAATNMRTAMVLDALEDVPPAEFEAAWREANRRATLSSPESPSGEPDGINHPAALQTPGMR